MNFTEKWVIKHQELITGVNLNTFIRLDKKEEKTPIYVLYKTLQPLQSFPKITLGTEVNIPIGRMLNLDNTGAKIGYLFEIPKQCEVRIEGNFFVATMIKQTKYSKVRTAFMTKDFSIFAPICDSIELVALNDIHMINIRKII